MKKDHKAICPTYACCNQRVICGCVMHLKTFMKVMCIFGWIGSLFNLIGLFQAGKQSASQNIWMFGNFIVNLILTIFLTITWSKQFKTAARRTLCRVFLGLLIFEYVVGLAAFIALFVKPAATPAPASEAASVQSSSSMGSSIGSGRRRPTRVSRPPSKAEWDAMASKKSTRVAPMMAQSCKKGMDLFCAAGVPSPIISMLASSNDGPAASNAGFLALYFMIVMFFCCCCACCLSGTACQVWVLGVFGSFYNQGLEEDEERRDGKSNDTEMQSMVNNANQVNNMGGPDQPQMMPQQQFHPNKLDN